MLFSICHNLLEYGYNLILLFEQGASIGDSAFYYCDSLTNISLTVRMVPVFIMLGKNFAVKTFIGSIITTFAIKLF